MLLNVILIWIGWSIVVFFIKVGFLIRVLFFWIFSIFGLMLYIFCFFIFGGNFILLFFILVVLLISILFVFFGKGCLFVVIVFILIFLLLFLIVILLFGVCNFWVGRVMELFGCMNVLFFFVLLSCLLLVEGGGVFLLGKIFVKKEIVLFNGCRLCFLLKMIKLYLKLF